MKSTVELVVYGVVIVGGLLWTWPRAMALWEVWKCLWNEVKDRLENQ